MSADFHIILKGVEPYREVWEEQKRYHSSLIASRLEKGSVDREYLILTQHSPVVTLGKHAKAENLLYSEERYKALGIECIRIERGGDVTYHGPGQLVAYPVIDLLKHHLGVKAYVALLEESVIRTIAIYGIKGERVEGASGVWIGKGTENERKIAAVGVKCSRFITMHGVALNVNTDLTGFSCINPCGFVDKGVTSMQRELGHDVNMPEVTFKFAEIFTSLLFNYRNAKLMTKVSEL